MSLKLGAQVLTYGAPWTDALETARLVDDLGYDYLWGHGHLYSTGGNPYQPFFEGWTTLAAWAATTRRIRLGLLVGANTFRNPGVVAKMAATIDHVSGGRSILGLGAGNVEFENRAHGIDPGRTLGERIDWFEEAIAIVIDLLAGREVTHHKREVPVRPRPPRARSDPGAGARGHRRRG
jgi:alkanesulfonate monooxygenase SsuD/methylene tetrahydromethanopterin reductase-like flavin-dependent oxidoreductase (luciferase family)